MSGVNQNGAVTTVRIDYSGGNTEHTLFLAGDIDSVGTWQIQGYVETSLGKFWTEKDTFKVYSTLATA